MRIGFWSQHLSERGTTTALYDYAFHNQKTLLNQSIVFYQKDHPLNFEEYVTKFNQEFKCYEVKDFSEIDPIILKEGIDALYIIKYGINDNVLVKNCPNLVHSVFVKDPHGERYAFVSRFLSEKYGNDLPYVPHMIDLPKVSDNLSVNLRERYNIPATATVFGGYGGKDSFNIPFVHSAIDQIVNEMDVYFLFMNFQQNTKPHPRIIYLEPTIDKKKKVEFINTCDAMIHARDIGETFGLSIGEFSSCGKPIITYKFPTDKEHIRILGDKGIYYSNMEELLDIFRNFEKKEVNCYQEYNAENVMKIFAKVFLNQVECEYNLKKWTLFQNDGISKHVMKGEGWEPHLTNLFQELIQEGDIVCDIGANFGYHTLTMSDCVGKNGRVYSFEPQRLIHNLLLKNIQNNGVKNVVPLKVAVGNENKETSFTKVNWLVDNQNMGDSYILENINNLGNNLENVLCLKMDHLISENINLIKIDVQGVELFTLQGMRVIIQKYTPYIVIEVENYTLQRFGYSGKTLFDYLHELNYTIFYIEYQYPSDHLCVHNSQISEFMKKYSNRIFEHVESNSLNNNLENGVKHKIIF